jgi:hypothetical protein
MKVKLLKKIRKRYTITHYPDGVYWRKDFIKGPYTVLWDNEDSWRYETSCQNKDEAYKFLYLKMKRWIELDYGPIKSKRNLKVETLWYKSVKTNKKDNIFITLLKIIKKLGKKVK